MAITGSDDDAVAPHLNSPSMEKSRTQARRVRPRALRRGDPLAERDLRRLIDRASDVIFRYRTHPRHGFEFVSPAITRITGYTPEELYADPESAINLPRVPLRPLGMMRRTLSTEMLSA
jgi:PAS domain-containing protein